MAVFTDSIGLDGASICSFADRVEHHIVKHFIVGGFGRWHRVTCESHGKAFRGKGLRFLSLGLDVLRSLFGGYQVSTFGAVYVVDGGRTIQASPTSELRDFDNRPKSLVA